MEAISARQTALLAVAEGQNLGEDAVLRDEGVLAEEANLEELRNQEEEELASGHDQVRQRLS